MHTSVAIIGGGLAGLYAAHRLHAARVDFLLLEARDRLGGRILTVGDDELPAVDGFDLGPSWFWPSMQSELAELVQSLQLGVFPQHSTGDVIFERTAREGPQRFATGEQEQLSFRIAGGTASLVRELARGIPEARVRTSAPVSAMQLREQSGDVELHVTRVDGSVDHIVARHVIAALPPRLLEASLTFAPVIAESSRRLWRATPTWMAPHSKYFALYDRPFWREAGLSGTAQSMVGPMPEIHDATTASGHAALFGFVGVSAERRAAVGDDALQAACVEQLVRMFGPEAGRPRATLLKDWAADRFTATVDDRVPGGHPTPRQGAWVEGPWQQVLTLGGSEVSPHEPGYLAGAVAAGRRAAEVALRTVGPERAS